jgi:hypothetical protein
MTTMIADPTAPFRYQGKPNADSARLTIGPVALVNARRISGSASPAGQAIGRLLLQRPFPLPFPERPALTEGPALGRFTRTVPVAGPGRRRRLAPAAAEG